MAELYTSRLFRLMALNLISGMVGIYMFQLGYKVSEIMLFFAAYFAIRALMAIPSGMFVARVGPKHAMLVSSFLYIPGLIALSQLEGTGLPALMLFAVLQSASVAMYMIAYLVDFSKVKHVDHAGKELGFMYIVEKIGSGLSPFLGGAIAFLFGPTTTMWVACVIFFFSAAPLFFSPEAVMTRQRITFRGFNWRATRWNFVSIASAGADQVSSLGVWALFVAIAVFGASGNAVYAQIGGLTTIAFASSLIFSKLYGALIDRRRGGLLLRSSAIANSAVYVLRPFVSTPLGVVLINIVNEAFTSGYNMPYLKGQFDMADRLPGYRIVYMTLMEVSLSLGAMVGAMVMCVLAYGFGDVRGLQLGFVAMAVLVLPIMLHHFPALRAPRLFGK